MRITLPAVVLFLCGAPATLLAQTPTDTLLFRSALIKGEFVWE